MSLNFTTGDPQAFEALTDALRAMDRYYRTRNIPEVEQAHARIDEALSQDHDYALAVFYKGVALDLIGKPADAPAFFERILAECDDSDLKLETNYNLGVAYYHCYSHDHLERAKSYFERVIEEATGRKGEDLKQLAQAHLAQAHAMWMRPSHKQLPDKRTEVSPEVREHIEHHFRESQTLAGALRDSEGTKSPRVRAICANATGMANMYYTDHVARDVPNRKKHLEIAKLSLLAAENLVPDDWANTCDLGSLELRLAVLARDEEATADPHFVAARDYLTRVVEKLRPGYGFALYELGILHRVWRKWQEAENYQQQSLQVPDEYRDISKKQVEEQRKRIDEKDCSFP